MSVKKLTRTSRKYDLSFKEDVIKMISSGRSISEVSQVLGVSVSLLHCWYKSARLVSTIPGKNRLLSSTSQNSSFAEIERLKGELRRTEQERANSKLDLISKLSQSLKEKDKISGISLQSLFGAYTSEETAEEIIAELRSSHIGY